MIEIMVYSCVISIEQFIIVTQYQGLHSVVGATIDPKAPTAVTGILKTGNGDTKLWVRGKWQTADARAIFP
jgi:hypothetical protein